MMTVRSAGLLALACALGHPAAAQSFYIQAESMRAPGNRIPVIADVTRELTSTTPWGTYTRTLRGKFWRSRDGQNRQDDAYGNSFVLNPRTYTWIDRVLKLAVIDVSEAGWFSTIPAGATESAYVRDHYVELKGKIAGRTAIGWRQEPRPPSGSEWWMDAKLGIPLLRRSWSPTYAEVLRVSNIQERDPDPDLFKIPEGYSILNCGERRRKRPPECGPDPHAQ